MGLRLWLEAQRTNKKQLNWSCCWEDLFRSRNPKTHFLVVVFLFPISFFFLLSILPHLSTLPLGLSGSEMLQLYSSSRPPTHDPSVIRLHCNYRRTASASSDVLPQNSGNGSKSGFCPRVWISWSVKCSSFCFFFLRGSFCKYNSGLLNRRWVCIDFQTIHASEIIPVTVQIIWRGTDYVKHDLNADLPYCFF